MLGTRTCACLHVHLVPLYQSMHNYIVPVGTRYCRKHDSQASSGQRLIAVKVRRDAVPSRPLKHGHGDAQSALNALELAAADAPIRAVKHLVCSFAM